MIGELPKVDMHWCRDWRERDRRHSFWAIVSICAYLGLLAASVYWAIIHVDWTIFF